VWIKDAVIAAITRDGDAAPDGFTGVDALATNATLFPGLIELHNHIAYNLLTLWQVPQTYTNRDTWAASDDYHKLVTAPMETLGGESELLPALVRYVELKSLVGGVTTTQGIRLFSAAGIARYYRGIVRNVEQTGDRSHFPEAASRIADVAAGDPQAFLTETRRHTCYLLHLSEGTDDAAHRHFEALKLADGQWAIAPSLAGIHCAALKAADFEILASHGASMVWSPFSNLLLYGQTADIAAAKAAGLKIGLGSDWSPSGSKSLFGELKVARLYSEHNNHTFSDQELVALATVDGSRILGWQDQVGTIEVGKRADLLVIEGQSETGYSVLFEGDERKVALVVVNGTPRYGTTSMMVSKGPDLERLTVGGEDRVLYLKQDQADPEVAALSYAQAQGKLKDALQNVKQIRLAQEGKHKATSMAAPAETERRVAPEASPRLALDEFESTGFTQRPHLPLDGLRTGPLDRLAASAPISSLLGPMSLDALTVADDPSFLDSVAGEKNLKPWLPAGLKQLYGV
jgi:cytosine/adenosine deaminase-related metal-dependent hydrolase